LILSYTFVLCSKLADACSPPFHAVSALGRRFRQHARLVSAAGGSVSRSARARLSPAGRKGAELRGFAGDTLADAL
jgi:hypothetical protein